MGSTYYASGSADSFLADRGFDDKWVHKEERKKDIWEEVKTNKKKQLSGAEKRARAAKISVTFPCFTTCLTTHTCAAGPRANKARAHPIITTHNSPSHARTQTKKASILHGLESANEAPAPACLLGPAHSACVMRGGGQPGKEALRFLG